MTAPFDSAAPRYDTDFTQTPLARALRARVWERLEALFPPGARVLELACGTGEDARHLAERGVQVLATDQSENMLELARKKCAGLSVEFAQLDLKNGSIGELGPFDGIFSNFGGLNAISHYQSLNLHSALKPGGKLLLVIMGRYCAWEILWYLLQGDPATAFRRLRRGGVLARVGEATMPVYYPSTAELRRALAPHCRLTRVWPLGNWLPPSYLEPLTRRRWFPFRSLAWLDRRWPWPLWADHTVYEWKKLTKNPIYS